MEPLDLTAQPASPEALNLAVFFLSRLVAENDAREAQLAQIEGAQPLEKRVTHFHSRTIPDISIAQYLQRLLNYFSMPTEALLTVLVYFERLAVHSRNRQLLRPDCRILEVNSYTVHRLLVTGLMVAGKVSSDIFYSNRHWAKVGGLPIAELNSLELQFVFYLNWSLIVRPEEIYHLTEKLRVKAGLAMVGPKRGKKQVPATGTFGNVSSVLNERVLYNTVL